MGNMETIHCHETLLDEIYDFWFLLPETRQRRHHGDWPLREGDDSGEFGAEEIRDRFVDRWRALLRSIREDSNLARRLAFSPTGDPARKIRFVALVVALDQFPRHFLCSTTETERAYAYERALEISLGGILHWTKNRSKMEEFFDQGGTHILFLLLPFRHTNVPSCREWGLETVDRLLEMSEAPGFDDLHPGCREIFELVRPCIIGEANKNHNSW